MSHFVYVRTLERGRGIHGHRQSTKSGGGDGEDYGRATTDDGGEGDDGNDGCDGDSDGGGRR